MAAPRTSKIVTDADYAAVLGRVFVSKTSYDVQAVQVVGKTKCYVRAVSVPMTSTRVPLYGDASHKIDWQKVTKPGPDSDNKEAKRYSLERFECGTYCISNTKDQFYAFMVDDESDQPFGTVER